MKRWLWRLTVAAALLAVGVIAFLLLAPSGRAAVKAALFIPEVVPSIPLHPQEWVTRKPIRERVSFPLPHGEGVGDLYRPAGGGRHAAVLLFLGVAPAGPEDPRVVGLGEALARSGMVAMIYWSPAMLERRIDPEDIANLAHAFQYLRGRDYVDPARVGMGGFCVGGSFALMAASLPQVREDVAFVNAFGPYFRMRDLLRALASGTRFRDGSTSIWVVDPLAREVFEVQLIESLEERVEAQLMWKAFREDRDPGRLDPGSLSEQGRAVYALLTGVPFEQVDSYVEQLPDSFLGKMEALSPGNYVDGLRAEVLIMHDAQDSLVPSDESHRLAQALSGRVEVRFTEFSLFKHMDPTRRVGFFTLVNETWKLFRHMQRIMLQAT
ncbi:MAG: dienelactone hydrolase family protein [Chloroflexi bacterium]|nr:dienelactone hydrolase family protein [Chloroflexota bacterium]